MWNFLLSLVQVHWFILLAEELNNWGDAGVATGGPVHWFSLLAEQINHWVEACVATGGPVHWF
ncbi:unnamed protein product, partial [Linum tenue]